MSKSPDTYYLGKWLVEPGLFKISQRGIEKRVEPQLMAVLQYMVTKAGKVIPKEELLDAVWNEVIVTDNVLTKAISSLRKVLEDDRYQPAYIETISKTGYRLVAKVELERTSKLRSGFLTTQKTIAWGISVVLLLLLGAFATVRVLPNQSDKVYHPVTLANYSTTEYWPAISPDGRFAAYSWRGEQDNNWDVYAKLIGTETIIRITDHPRSDLRAQWSPDGNYIYFLRYENGGSTIYKKSLLGEEEIRILQTPEFSSGNFDISPDEKWVVLNGREDRSTPLKIKLISLETGEEQWLTRPQDNFNGDIHPTFSPDGKKLAFIREKNPASMQLWLLDLSTQELEQISTTHISINGFDWSADGRSLVFGSNQSGLYKLWELNLAKRKIKLLTAGDYQMVMPRIASTGRLIYAKMQDNVNIWSYKPKLKVAEPWLATNDLNLNPVLAPKGKKVCFTMKKGQTFQLWTAELDGSKSVPITNFAGQYLSAPRWSADGEYIVFQGFRDGQSDIFRVESQGGIPLNLTRSKSDDHTPFYTKEHIYFSSNRNGEWGIFRMTHKGVGLKQIVGGNAYAPQLSVDERFLFYCKKDKPGLWVYDFEKLEEDLLIETFHPMYWGAYTLAKNGVYYLNTQNHRFEYFNLNTRQSTVMYQPQARVPRLGISLNWSEQAQLLLFSQIDHHDADIMLLEEK